MTRKKRTPGSGTSSAPAALALGFKFGKAVDVGYGGMDRLPVTIQLKSGGKPLPDLKVKLTAGPEQVIDPSPEPFTNQKGEVVFFPTFPNGGTSIEMVATVFFVNGQTRQYTEIWNRGESEKPSTPQSFEVEEGGVDQGKSCYRIKFVPGAEVKIRSQRKIFWGSEEDDLTKGRSETITLDNNGEAEIFVLSGDHEGMMISFQSGGVSSEDYWLYGKSALGKGSGTGLVASK